MAASTKFRSVFRWVAWPVAIIVALNIENAASEAGYGTLINRHWKESIPVLKSAYEIATSPWIIYPTLMILGAVIYERIVFAIERADKPGSKRQRWLIKFNSDVMSAAFLTKGYFRKSLKLEQTQKMNRRLLACGLPQVPETFSENEELNKVYGSYFALLSKGQFEHAREFIEAKEAFIKSAT